MPQPQFAVFIEYRNRTYRYFTPGTDRALWARSTAMRHVRANTHPPYQMARLVPESELSNWIVGAADTREEPQPGIAASVHHSDLPTPPDTLSNP